MKRRPFFISYRRVTDGPAATAIVAELEAQLGPDSVFFDQSERSIPPASQWDSKLVSELYLSQMTLVIVGPEWLKELTRRAALPEMDWVRLEIALSLQFGKRVLMVLVNGADVPREKELPADLRELSRRQLKRLDLSQLQSQARSLIEYSQAEPDVKIDPVPLSPLDLPETPPPLTDLMLKTSGGQGWDPASEKDSPHAFDYKYAIVNESLRHHFRVNLISGAIAGQLRTGFSMGELAKSGTFLKYQDSQSKQGMFIQASCIVTDGMKDGVVKNVLVCVRNDFQFHDPTKTYPRNIDGASCLIGTCLASFNFHRKPHLTPHLPIAILNDLRERNLWGVFSRKLLIPEAQIDCRFAGIGFNLTNPNKEYVHLIWHVRTDKTPPAMLVPARAEKQFDVPVWRTLEQASKYDFKKAPIDRAVLSKLFNFPNSGGDSTRAELAALIPFTGMEGLTIEGDKPRKFWRETVLLDLVRIFQQRVNSRQIMVNPAGSNLLQALAGMLANDSAQFNFNITVTSISIENSGGWFESWLEVALIDENEKTLATHRILAVPMQFFKTDDIVKQARRVSSVPLSTGFPPDSVIVIRCVGSDEWWEFQGASSLHEQGRTPIHVVQIAMPVSQPLLLKRVAHAIIPICAAGQKPDRVIITQPGPNRRPRLPGGGIKDLESPEQAVKREVFEELGILEADIRATQLILGDPHIAEERSPTNGVQTRYQLYPFLLRIDESGRQPLFHKLKNPDSRADSRVMIISIDEWREKGLGFDPTYARTVLDNIAFEDLAEAAITIP